MLRETAGNQNLPLPPAICSDFVSHATQQGSRGSGSKPVRCNSGKPLLQRRSLSLFLTGGWRWRGPESSLEHVLAVLVVLCLGMCRENGAFARASTNAAPSVGFGTVYHLFHIFRKRGPACCTQNFPGGTLPLPLWNRSCGLVLMTSTPRANGLGCTEVQKASSKRLPAGGNQAAQYRFQPRIRTNSFQAGLRAAWTSHSP